MTTTISTVGYGDIKAFNDFSGDWAVEMTYLICTTISGLILFSSVLNEILNYLPMPSVDKIVTKTLFEMEDYLYRVSRVIKTSSLTED